MIWLLLILANLLASQYQSDAQKSLLQSQEIEDQHS
jgi:hypothetical protein